MARLPKDPRVNQYSSSAGIPLRTAQDHRRKNDRRWLAFIGQDLEQVDEMVKAIAETAIVAGKTKEQAMMDSAFETWQAIDGLKRIAANKGRAEQLPSLCKAVGDAQKSFVEAKRYHIAAELARKNIYTGEDLKGYERAARSLRQVMEKMPGEAGARANPMDKGFGIKALNEWLETRLLPELIAQDLELEKLRSHE